MIPTTPNVPEVAERKAELNDAYWG